MLDRGVEYKYRPVVLGGIEHSEEEEVGSGTGRAAIPLPEDELFAIALHQELQHLER